MIDFAKCLQLFSENGFDMGYYVSSDKHIEMKLIYPKKNYIVNITICFHIDCLTKYHFQLLMEGNIVFQRRAEQQTEITFIIDNINKLIEMAPKHEIN